MKKYLPLCVIAIIAANGMGSPAWADDNKIVTGMKKVGSAIVWPFKKVGQGLKAVGKKLTGK
jgi:hypothetical protein